MPPSWSQDVANVRIYLYQDAHCINANRNTMNVATVKPTINLEQNKTGPSPAITQADLNRIIQTAHKAATAQGILAVKPG